MSKYLLITCYECNIRVSVHDSYQDVEDELKSLRFDEGSISEIMIGDTFNDLDDRGYVKVQRIDL